MRTNRQKLEALRRLAENPGAAPGERAAALAAMASYEAKLAEDTAEPTTAVARPTRARALPSGPASAVVMILDQDERAVASRQGRRAYTLSIIEINALGEKHVVGRWLTRLELEWSDPELYLGFFGEGGRPPDAGERVAGMRLVVPEHYALRKLFDASTVMSLFVETPDLGMVYFGRAFITEIDSEGWETTAWIAALDEATQVVGLEPDVPALAAPAERPKLGLAHVPALPPGEPTANDA